MTAEEVFHSLDRSPAFRFLDYLHNWQHRIAAEPGLGEHGDRDLLLAAREFVPPAVHDQHAAVAGNPDGPLVGRALHEARS